MPKYMEAHTSAGALGIPIMTASEVLAEMKERRGPVKVPDVPPSTTATTVPPRSEPRSIPIQEEPPPRLSRPPEPEAPKAALPPPPKPTTGDWVQDALTDIYAEEIRIQDMIAEVQENLQQVVALLQAVHQTITRPPWYRRLWSYVKELFDGV